MKVDCGSVLFRIYLDYRGGRKLVDDRVLGIQFSVLEGEYFVLSFRGDFGAVRMGVV